MKTKVTLLLVLFSLTISTTTYAQWWRDLARGAAEVIGAAFVTNEVEKYGGEQYGNREKAEQFTRDLFDALGVNSKNVEYGVAWNNAENSYQRQSIVKDVGFDVISKNSNRPDYIELVRKSTQREIDYLEGMSKATNDEERQKVISRKTLAFNDIWSDASKIRLYNDSIAVLRRIDEKLKMEERLKGLKGEDFSNDDVINGASFIVATIQSNELTEKEKEEYISQLGLNQSPKEIINIVRPLLNEDNEAELRRQAELKRQKEEERRIAEEKRLAELKAAEERRNALQSLGSMKIDGFAFDVTELSDEQKPELDEAANILNKYSDVNVLLTGHTCKIGHKSINQRKGMKRAESAKAYLMSKGVAENRIATDSKGETEPLMPNTSRENFKQNRRVEFQIVK